MGHHELEVVTCRRAIEKRRIYRRRVTESNATCCSDPRAPPLEASPGGGAHRGSKVCIFQKRPLLKNRFFGTLAAMRKLRGGGGKSALGATRSGSTFPFYKRKGVLARLLMKGSANPTAQVSMCIYLLMKGSANPKAQVSMNTYLRICMCVHLLT